MRMAKADEEDFERTLKFLKACENMWSKRPYEWHEAAEGWETDWDDEDTEKIELLCLKKKVAKELGVSVEDVDHRIVVYEWIRSKYKRCDNGWARVYWAADILIRNTCDPQKDYLDYSPYLEEIHVANEQ